MMTTHGRGGWIEAGFMLVLALAITAAPASAQGRKHALLVGVGDYIHDNVRDLEAPRNDVDSLQQVLRGDWAFDRITTLVDHDATRTAILGALEDLIRETRPGDYVFIFFSGHGTSSSDSDAAVLAALLDPGTGALLPADVDPRSPDAGDVLLVGRRDLRPLLQELDRGRDVFVVFDACYSGNTARGSSISPEEAAPKYQEWPTRPTSAFGAATRTYDDAGGDHYPYENLVYLAASAQNEKAWEIKQKGLEKYPTIDGRPHGVLTDALLRGLAGDADTDGNGILTVRELHRHARRFVETLRFPQTPQLLRPSVRSDATERPVFDTARPAVSLPTEEPVALASTALRVQLSADAYGLRDRIAALDDVSVVTGEYDISVNTEGPGAFTVWHGSGDLLTSVPLDADEVVQRVAWQALIHELLVESFRGQNFNVELNILDVKTVRDEDGRQRRQVTARTNAELFVGRTYEMTYGADVPAYFLLVSVDVHGVMRLLVPWTEQDLSSKSEGRIPDLNVSRPTGTEFVKLFAFRERPAGLEAWLPERGAGGRSVVRSIESRRELDSLLQFVRAHAEVAAETVRKFPSVAVGQ